MPALFLAHFFCLSRNGSILLNGKFEDTVVIWMDFSKLSRLPLGIGLIKPDAMKTCYKVLKKILQYIFPISPVKYYFLLPISFHNKDDISAIFYSKTPLVGTLIGVKITRVAVDHELDFDTN